MQKRFAFLTVGLILSALVLVVSILCMPGAKEPDAHITASNWQALWNTSSKPTRQHVARYLVEQRILLTQKPAAIISILGHPDKTNALPSSWSLMWDLGLRKSGSQAMFPYHEYLVISLSDQGEAQECRIVNLDN